MRHALLTLALLGGTSACLLVYGFDRFDDTATTDGGATFSLAAPTSVAVEPGTSVTLDVRFAGRDPAAVTIAAEPDDPAALTIGSTVTDGGVTLTLDVPASVAPSTHAIHLRAAAGATIVERDVRVDVQGTPCHLDRGFADAGVATLPFTGVASVLVSTTDGITLATASAIVRLTPGGQAVWNAPLADALALAIDERARTVVAASDGVRRIGVEGGADPSFMTADSPQSCTDVTIVDGSIVLLCGGGAAGWFLIELDDTGNELTSVPTLFGAGSVPVPRTLAAHQGGLVACGTDPRGRGLAAFARWSRPDTVDTAFGVGGRFLLEDGTSAVACVGQGSAIVAAGTWGTAPALYAIDTKGVAQLSFGDGGVVPLEADTQIERLLDLVGDRSQLIALVNRQFHPYVVRFSANGAFDAAFGTCVLDSLGLAHPTKIAVTSDHRLVVVAGDDAGRVRVGRLWL